MQMEVNNICNWLKVGKKGALQQELPRCLLSHPQSKDSERENYLCSLQDVWESEIKVCRACGRDKIRHKHQTIEKQAKKQFSLVLAQLRGLENQLEIDV